MATIDPDFPYSVSISIPLPSHRLASSALRALQVDAELSPLVRRELSVTTPAPSSNADATESMSNGVKEEEAEDDEAKTVLRTDYKATTNRMLRVAVNGFMESIGVVLGVMEELDVDVLKEELAKP